ncbi:amidohydrolase family protein [Actinomycetospora aeridis]|uniref:Amidohydrolase family protein n=1 Tax=Actinomycetospora aeridis TaxID=3129231 RepID=A0ABU8NB81_9PSEU
MPLIAVEEHWVAPRITAALAALPPGEADGSLALNDRGDTLDRLADLGEGRLRAMDAQGIDLAIVSHAPPGTQALPAADAVTLARDANDAVAEAVDRHPTRLRAMATLPLTAPDAAAAELERAAGLGHVGAMVHGRARDLLLDDPVLDDVFAVAAARDLPVFIHPQIPAGAVRDAVYSGFDPVTDLGLATFGWGWHVEAATAALRLILRGTFDRHPDLQIVLGHWGELLLFWLDRADSLARVRGLERSVTDYVRTNVVVTSSGMFNPALLRHVLSVTTADRLVFSTDYPFQQPTADEIETFLGEFGAADREAVSHTTARSLFGLG